MVPLDVEMHVIPSISPVCEDVHAPRYRKKAILTPARLDSPSYISIESRSPCEFLHQQHSLKTFKDLKILIVVTMYNENKEDLALTLKGIVENLGSFVDHLSDDQFWKQFAVCIISDGFDEADPDTLRYMESVGLYDASRINTDKRTWVHLFENSITFKDERKKDTNYPPLQTIFALKQHQAGKVDSQWWYFRGFCEYLKPQYNVLIDVGTRPREHSMIKFYNAFESNSRIGGVCGQLTTRSLGNFNCLAAAQHFEYKATAIFDKGIEAVYGFISVLPGAFSAYRYEALQGKPLDVLFERIEKQKELSLFESNMYLTEDRLPCFEIISKKNKNWMFHFSHEAIAEADTPQNIVELLKQRRRWSNGWFFCLIYILQNFPRIWMDTSHSFIEKSWITVQFAFYLVSVVLYWFSVSSIYVYLGYVIVSVSATVSDVFFVIYGFLIIMQIVVALQRPDLKKWQMFYEVMSITLGIVFVIHTLATVLGLTKSIIHHQKCDLALYLFFGIGAYHLSSFFFGDFASIVLSFSQYWLLLPTFHIMFPIYAICNIDDVSWGTKGIHPLKLRHHYWMKNAFVFAWIISNVALVYVYMIAMNSERRSLLMPAVLFGMLFFSGFRFMLSLYFWATRVWSGKVARWNLLGESEISFSQMVNTTALPPFSCLSLDSGILSCFMSIFLVDTFVAIFGFLWCSLSAILSLLLSFVFPVGPACLSFFAFSWRTLGAVEAMLQSRARVDSRTLLGSMNSRNNGIVDLVLDEFTWTCLGYFLICKPIVVGIQVVSTLTLFLFSFWLVAHPTLAQLCRVSDGTVCMVYMKAMDESWFLSDVMSLFFGSIIGMIVGVLFAVFTFFISCYWLVFMHVLGKRVALNALGVRESVQQVIIK